MNVSKISFALHRLAASKCFYLCKLGVTHVLNAAEGRKEKNGTVDTSKVFNNEQRYVQTSIHPLFCQEYYEPWGITYKGIQLVDVPQTNITIYFNEVVDFIDQALAAGGKVLVNCEMGMSRSSTCVLAYLMLRHQMSAGEALAKVFLHLFSMKRK